MSGDDLARLAELAVAVGANVQPGQVVGVTAEYDQHEFARAVAAAAYRRGARFVDVWYFDPLVKRARIALAGEDTLDYVPPWYGERVLSLGRERAAVISIRGSTVPGALDGLDPARAGRDQLPFLRESMTVINDRSVNWTVVAYPSPAWARLCFPELSEDEALARLWRELLHVCRLDEPDPLAAWDERLDVLARTARALDAARFDAVHLEGPGTDLTLGLLPSSTWQMARWETAGGIRHLPNVPTEEVFTTPDPERVDGHVRSTRPLVLADGTVVRGIEIRFEGGRAVEIRADEGGGVLQGRAAIDEGACRVGELALVDRESRIGRLGTTFFETLLDENAASHIALGAGIAFAVADEADRSRVNTSAIHIDLMVGSPEVDVTGITAAGERVPVLREGAWQLPAVHEA
ncbi:MAG TPA: aminopeptidase [Gaiellaceae bacterium]|nr:aminopeptidase [Gaiellaceae bacterium]